MEDLTFEQWMEKYPYLKEIAEFTLFTTFEDLKKIKNSKKIIIDDQEISIEFLKRILQDDKYYNYASRFFNNEIPNFHVCYIIGGDTCGTIYYSKTQIIKGIEQLILSSELILQSEERQKYEKLRAKVSFESFLEKNESKNYTINIDGNNYVISINEIISLMQLSAEEFDKLCSSKETKNIDDIPKEYFIYASYVFFEKNRIFEEYIMPSTIKERFNDIKSLQKIDLEAINKHLETEDTKFREVQLDPNLENLIITGMPQDASDLEKAIYMYIKMCKILTYDDEYFAVNQQGVATIKHKDLKYVSRITPSNNKVVCFEFNLIYSKFLDKLGIKFRSEYKNMVGESYGDGHANLDFRSGKYLVRADSVTSIIQGDIMQAKLNQPLVGLKCLNCNLNTQQEFKNAIFKIYKLIDRQEHQLDENHQVEHIQTFEELLSEYIKSTNNYKAVDLNEKLSILIEKVNTTKMVGIDSLSYVLQLRKILFNEQERKDNLSIVIIRNNKPLDPERVAMASAIIALNQQSFENNLDQTIYYYFNPNHDLIPISREELQAKFDNGLFAYVEENDPKIPGINEIGGIKKC